MSGIPNPQLKTLNRIALNERPQISSRQLVLSHATDPVLLFPVVILDWLI